MSYLSSQEKWCYAMLFFKVVMVEMPLVLENFKWEMRLSLRSWRSSLCCVWLIFTCKCIKSWGWPEERRCRVCVCVLCCMSRVPYVIIIYGPSSLTNRTIANCALWWRESLYGSQLACDWQISGVTGVWLLSVRVPFKWWSTVDRQRIIREVSRT